MSLRVIVCGGRYFDDADSVYRTLAKLPRSATIIHGGASGADLLAKAAALKIGFASIEEYPADWEKYGRRAGPVRNQEMLDSGVDLVIAFLGGRGTRDMVMRAYKAEIPVIEVPVRSQVGRLG